MRFRQGGPAASRKNGGAAVIKITDRSGNLSHANAVPRSAIFRPQRARFSFDGDYIRRLIAGDPATERHFTEYFGELLSRKLRARLRSPELVEDARQETFVRVLVTLKEAGGLATPESLGAFVIAVCNNVLLETYRSAGRTTPLDTDTHEPSTEELNIESRVLQSEEQLEVRKAIAELPAKDQDLIRWLFFEDRHKDDVCRELRVDREYLRVLLYRAKRRLRERFAGRGRRGKGSRKRLPLRDDSPY